jgi:hypothetical protein
VKGQENLSFSTLFEVKFSTLFDVGVGLTEGLSECVENFTSNSVENDRKLLRHEKLA